MSRGLPIKDYLNLEYIPDLLLYLRGTEKLSYGKITRYMNDEGFDISETSIRIFIKDYLGGDPLGRVAWSRTTGPKKRLYKKNNGRRSTDPLNNGYADCGRRVSHSAST